MNGYNDPAQELEAYGVPVAPLKAMMVQGLAEVASVEQLRASMPGFDQMAPAMVQMIAATPGLAELTHLNPALALRTAAALVRSTPGQAPAMQGAPSGPPSYSHFDPNSKEARKRYIQSELRRRIRHPDLDAMDRGDW